MDYDGSAARHGSVQRSRITRRGRRRHCLRHRPIDHGAIFGRPAARSELLIRAQIRLRPSAAQIPVENREKEEWGTGTAGGRTRTGRTAGGPTFEDRGLKAGEQAM